MVIGFLGVLWAVEVCDIVMTFLSGFSLDGYGIRPRRVAGLVGIPLAPVLHGGIGHLAGNTIPLFVLSLLALIAGTLRGYLRAVWMIILIGGLGIWLFGRSNTIHIGASSIVFGLTGYVVALGVMARTLRWVLVAIVVMLLFGGLLSSLVEIEEGISWTGHAFGLVAGVVAAVTAKPPPEGLSLVFSQGVEDSEH